MSVVIRVGMCHDDLDDELDEDEDEDEDEVDILLLEKPCLFVRPSVTFFTQSNANAHT